MNKKLLVSSIIVLALIVSLGFKKSDLKKVEDNNKSSLAQDDHLIESESIKIDFSRVEHQSSQNQRNEALEKVIVDYLDYHQDQDGKLVYYYNNIDLNGDNIEELFVYLLGQSVTGSGGSTALIVDKESNKVISDFSLVQNPIIISKEKTNGWNDIIMQVSGGGSKLSYVKMKFNGKEYPSNPSIEPLLEDKSVIEGIAIISNTISIDNGLELK